MRRVSADVTWEDRRREPQVLYFESADADARLEPNAHAFVAAAAAPALSRGESRILVEGTLSPRFRDGMTTVFETLVRWRRPNRRAPRIETTHGFEPVLPLPGAEAAVLLSGGLDSLALLQKNRSDFPADHPRSYETALFVRGFDIEKTDEWSLRHYERAGRSLEALATGASLRLVRVGTNLKRLGSLWAEEHQSGAMAAVGYACTGRVRTVDIASTHTWGTLFPYGSHPILDRHYSGDALEVRHMDAERGRLEKMRALVDWPAGLAALRVCWEGEPPAGYLNCGACHKCALTLLELLAADGLEACPAFPVQEVTPALAERLREYGSGSVPFLSELIEPLEARGRADLAEIVQRKITCIQASVAQPSRRPFWQRALRRRQA